MDDLVQFLRDRLDEDFEAVRLVLGVNVMAAIRRGESAPRWVPSPKGDAGVWDTNGQPRVKFVWTRERDHIIRHDPARVLVEVEAKRRLLGLHASRERGDGCVVCDDGNDSCGCLSGPSWGYPCDTVKVLALPYVDHPDYRPEWRP